jgi:hypothetical protein
MNAKPIFILFAMALILAGCSGRPAARAAAGAPQESPEQVVQQFYNWYLDERESAPKDARQSGVLTADLTCRIEASRLSGELVNFVCAQDFPESVTVGSASLEGDQASVPVETSWGGRLEIRLLAFEGEWLIDEVQCLR